MKRYALTAIWVGSTAVAVFGQNPQPKLTSAPMLNDKQLVLQVEQVPLTGTTSIVGDSSKQGVYVVRTHLAPNSKIRPRYYDQDRIVTVMKGTWWVGQGEVFRLEKVVPVREGGVMFVPANLKHYEVAGSSEVVLQITGNGPVTATHAEVDMTGQPVPVGGPYPEDAIEGEGGRRRGRRGAPPPAAPNPATPQQPDPQQPQ